eukprot:PhF_6_TR24121/c0_g1_i1/m.33670
MLNYLTPYPSIVFTLFLLNGLGEVATGIKWLLFPHREFPHLHNEGVAFLFRAWAFSIIGFGITSLHIAFTTSSSSNSSSYVFGGIVYHAFIGTHYFYEIYRGSVANDRKQQQQQGKVITMVPNTIAPRWVVGGILHYTALLFFVLL